MTSFLHACYRVVDIEVALAFYGALGLDEMKRYDISDAETKVMVGFPGDGARLGLTVVAGATEYELGTGYNHVAFEVASMAAAIAAVESHGGAVEQAPFRKRAGGSQIAFVTDPDGYRIELVEKA